MKKILVISSSPRIGGNSDLLCDSFIKGAKEAGNEVEKINLAKLKIEYCEGCYLCSDSKCFKNDDAEMVISKMLEADVYVLATPVYFYSMSAQLKALFDRCVTKYTQMNDKEVYIFITAWDPVLKNLESTVEAIRGFSRDCLEGTIERGVIMAGDVQNKGDVLNKKDYDIAYQLGLKA